MEFEASFIDPLNLPIDWKVLGFPDLVFFQEGPGIRNWQYVERDGVRFVNIRCLEDGRLITSKMSQISKEEAYGKYSHFLLDADDYVVSSSGTLGRVATVQTEDLPCCLNTSVIRMRPANDGLERGYLKYFLFSDYYKSQIFAFANGSAQLNYGPTHLKQMEIIAPPVADQKAIAHILGTLDDKIEQNRKTNETLEAIAKALFKSWFVDFDPVRAKAEGCPTGLPAEISDLFPDSFEDSELGEIPSGWETGRLDEILEIDPPRQLKRGSVSPYLEMKGVPTSGHSAVDVVGREFSSGSKFRNGDTLLARITPCLENGKTAFVDFLKDGEMGWGSTEFIVMCGRREEANPFAYYLARSEVFRNNAIRNMVGSSGRQRVPSDAVSGFTLPLPPREILVKFGLLATYLMRRISATADQSVILSKIRDALLPKLISGEIRIPDAEKMLKEVDV
jgi:type I restriction enzyme S subunit